MDAKSVIFIIDDDSKLRVTLSDILKAKGYMPITFETGKSALEAAQNDPPVVALIDLKLKVMSGLEVMKKIKERSPFTECIILTGHASKASAIEAVNLGAYSYLEKPYDVEQLLVSILRAIEKRKAEQALQKTNNDLKQTVLQLKRANQRILEQQKSVIEEERLKVLLQMAGATAHELNQPLFVLLGNIELIGICKDNYEKLSECITAIEDAGNRISDIVKKIQTIRHYETKAYFDGNEIINIDQDLNILSVEDDKMFFSELKKMLSSQGMTKVFHGVNIKETKALLTKNIYDLILLEYKLPDGDAFDLIKFITSKLRYQS